VNCCAAFRKKRNIEISIGEGLKNAATNQNGVVWV
jgi:hypothetical protein